MIPPTPAVSEILNSMPSDLSSHGILRYPPAAIKNGFSVVEKTLKASFAAIGVSANAVICS
jgi:hypothetical protein